MPNFFQLYHEYTKKTEPPPNYHAWSAISAISALLGKKCQIPQGHFTVFPQLYIILVGSAGMRKSSAMNIAKNILRLVETVPIAADSGSREGLIDDMAGNRVEYSYGGKNMAYWQSAAFVTEMKEFLGASHLNDRIVSFLTTIWDENIFKERTRKGGTVIINNPYFSILGCCTPGWMNENLKEDVITDGFSRRTIFVLEDTLNCLNSWPESTPSDFETLAKLVLEAKRINKIQGTFELSQPARQIYDQQYYKMREQAEQHGEKVQSYFTSKHILALKLAMCLSAGLNDSLLVTEDVMKTVFIFLEQSERALDTVFAGVGRNELKSLVEKGLQRIRATGRAGMTKAEFLRVCYDDMKKIEVDEAWEVLMSTGAVQPVELKTAQDVPRVRAVVSNPLTPAVNLLELVSRLSWRPEQKMAATSAFSAASPLAPETERLLANEEERKVRLQKGVLLSGKRPQAGDGPQLP